MRFMLLFIRGGIRENFELVGGFKSVFRSTLKEK